MRKALQVVAWIVGGLAALVAIVYAVGLFLPIRHSVTATRDVSATPEEVWDAITTVAAFPEWRPGVERAESLEPIAGWPAWREHGPEGTITFVIAAVEPQRRLVAEIVDEGLPFGGRWMYVLEPTATGTRLSITEEGFVYNPFYRFVSRFFMDSSGTAEAYLDALEVRLAG